MSRFTSGIGLAFAITGLVWQIPVVAAELPTAEAILRIHHLNKDRLSHLHLRVAQRFETTEDDCRLAQKEADEKEKFIRVASQRKADEPVEIYGKTIKGEEATRILRPLLAQMKAEVRAIRAYQSKPALQIDAMEFFLNEGDYQFRKPLKTFESDEDFQAWGFPDVPLTPESLLGPFSDISIFSRSAQLTPAARWWSGSSHRFAYIMQKHLGDVMSLRHPPFTDVTHPQWDRRHPYDTFFSRPAEDYRIIRQEHIDGSLLTVVDVVVAIAESSSTLMAYRGWLDLQRGALPVKMYHRQNSGKAPDDQFDRWQPNEILTTDEVRELPNGAFYPAKIVSEAWERDPDAPELSKAEWLEVQAGQRKIALVVRRRNTWAASVVEIPSRFDDRFYIIPFPEGQTFFDHDARKVIGALASKPLVEIGQKAPPLTIAHWGDETKRTLDDLRGQVVVLDFWGLWCGACRSNVPQLQAIQRRFGNQPVTFVCVHTADRDIPALAARIKEFQEKNDWRYLSAIDTGSMIEDSVTTTAYGIRGFPTRVIIGRDGRIAYVDPDLGGPRCDEEDPTILADFQKKIDDFRKRRFESVGEPWPVPAGLDEQQQDEIFQRVEQAFIAQQIDVALKSTP